jgi:hypothetical protein
MTNNFNFESLIYFNVILTVESQEVKLFKRLASKEISY